MNEHTLDLMEELRTWLRPATKVVVAGIGNSIRTDDYVGVKVVEDLQGKVSAAVHLIECETVPESFVDEIVQIRPSHVLLIDAAILGLRPGTVHLYMVDEVMNVPTISSHTLPLRVFCDYLKLLTGTNIALILIEPRNTDFGEGMTSDVQEAGERVKAALQACLP
jgi:hydrogenase 3 maturation protease